MGSNNGERIDTELQEVRNNWLLMVCVTAIILIGRLATWYKYIWKPGLRVIPYRRLDFEKYAMVAGATWLGTSICFAVEETLLFSKNLQWFHRWHFATTVVPICAMLCIFGIWIWKHLDMLLQREASIYTNNLKGIQNEMETKQDQANTKINLLRQELIGHQLTTKDDIQQLQRMILDLETLQRNFGGNTTDHFYEIQGMVLERMERIENMMRPLLPTTQRVQLVLHADNESPMPSSESTGSESSTAQIIATQHQMARLRRELEEAVLEDDEERKVALANMIEQLEIEVDQEREARRAAAR